MLAGKYRVERTLSQGVAGMVLAARHVRSRELVAVRVLPPELALHADVAAGFLHGARDARRIRGEHAVRIDDVDTDESGAPFIVMEYLEGQSLRDLVESGGPLPSAAAVGLVEQALEAVAEAHALGIVHRDLRLENLFLVLRPDGSPCVKVLGFGVSTPSGKDLDSFTARCHAAKGARKRRALWTPSLDSASATTHRGSRRALTSSRLHLPPMDRSRHRSPHGEPAVRSSSDEPSRRYFSSSSWAWSRPRG